MPPKFGNATKRHTIVFFRFIEGISIILKLRQVKLLQIEGWFVTTPHEQFSWNSRISVFERQNSSNWSTVIWNIFLVLDIKFNPLKLLQMSSKFFEDAWRVWNSFLVFKRICLFSLICFRKHEFGWCKISYFPKFQKSLVLKLLFQVVWYHRENVWFWWLTQRWIALILNFLTHCSTLSQLCFPLISVDLSVNTL